MTRDCVIQLAAPPGATSPPASGGRVRSVSLELPPSLDGSFLGSSEGLNDAMAQARECGAEELVLLSGESPLLPQALDTAVELGMRVELVLPPPTMISQETARMASGVSATIVLKLALTQSDRARYRASHPSLRAMLDLRDQGVELRLAVIIPTPAMDADCTRHLWQWAREEGVEPRLELVLDRHCDCPDGGPGRASADRMAPLLHEIERIDTARFGRPWSRGGDVQTRACLKPLWSCVIDATGSVFACCGLGIPLGNLRSETLRSILLHSEVLENLRNRREMIKSPCDGCQQAACFGCRGAAWAATGDYLAADPLCHNVEEKDLHYLPSPAAGLIPHGPSIQMVDRLLEIGERTIQSEYLVRRQSPFVNAQGRLDPVALVELFAQTLAASRGFQASQETKLRHRGLLLGVKNLVIRGPALAGQRLTCSIRKTARLGDFGIAEGSISDDQGTCVATGELKVWTSTTEPGRPA